jgi:hypothetical protein
VWVVLVVELSNKITVLPVWRRYGEGQSDRWGWACCHDSLRYRVFGLLWDTTLPFYAPYGCAREGQRGYVISNRSLYSKVSCLRTRLWPF